MSSLISGGYCDGVPPLPIPNREVKPVCADGTAMQCGRVGSRLLLQKTLDNRNVFQGLFLFSWLCLIIVAIVVIVTIVVIVAIVVSLSVPVLFLLYSCVILFFIFFLCCYYYFL